VYCNVCMVTTLRQLRQVSTRSKSATAFRFGGQHVVELLNSSRNSASERVRWAVEAFHQIIRLNESIRLPSGFGPGERALIAEAAEISKELNARLSRFKQVPVVLYFPSGNPCFKVQNQFVVSKEMAKETVSEGLALMWLLDHIDTVYLIRRCHRQQCRKWFFAVTEHQKYCSENCRKRDAQQGPEFKRKRAQYMKKYRSEEAERNARAKRLARGKSK
jgi:hypothetical protein